MKKKKLLLVEDEAITALQEQQELLSYGYDVIVASSGEEAAELACKPHEAIDLILMDIELGEGMDGVATASRILKKIDIPILFLSHHTEPEIVKQTENIPCFGYVVKNSGVSVLDASIKMALRAFKDRRGAPKEQENLQVLLQMLAVPVFYKNTEGRYTGCNQAFEDFLGLSRDQIIGKSVYDISPKEIADIYQEKDQELFENPGTQHYEWQVERSNGERRAVLFHKSTLMDPQGNLTGLVGVITDITERKQAEEALKQSEQRYRQLIQNANEAVFVAQAGMLVLVNPMMENLTGYSAAALMACKFTEFIYPDDRELVQDRHIRRMRGEDVPSRYSFRIQRKDHQIRWVELSSVTINWEGEPATLNFLSDSTEQKQVNVKLLKQKYFLTKVQEMGNIGTWELDIQKNNMNWTDQCYKLFGVPLGTEMNLEIFLSLVHPDDQGYALEKWNAGLNRQPYDIEHRIIVDGSVKWVREKADIEFDENGVPVMAVGFAQEITERKEAEEQIKASLKEKETLLQEIHHRVKNNMQVISSLLSLQANRTKDERIKEALNESKGRVYAMSAVHETLYDSENFAEIDIKSYLVKIINAIGQAHSKTGVDIAIEADDVKIDIKRASPVGLIINELLSNSFKYAFPDKRTGNVEIHLLKLNESELELTVSDNGIGIPDSIDWKHSETLGLRLVRILVENQLDGSLEMDNKNGTQFTIRFTIDEP